MPRRTTHLPSSFLDPMYVSAERGGAFFHMKIEGKYDAVFGYFSGGKVDFEERGEIWRGV